MSHAVDPSAAEARALEGARQGELAAFNQLVLMYQTAVFNVALRTLGNPDDAADAAQETFVSAFRAIREFRGGSFKAWLLRITVNSCYDIVRRRQRRPASSLDELGERADGDFGPSDLKPGPEQTALSTETARAIQDGLATLPAEQRLLVLLCDVQGLSYEEAAGATQVALGTVKSRLSRARARLRDYLRERGELPSHSRRHMEETEC
ncbi:MAG TPA: sigma-70 family RNA polymerase sigma factor [Chloroflexota bacterium]|nr:sigma-70 family RNA polymerase sigma factor [Chloroflexota bacterium]